MTGWWQKREPRERLLLMLAAVTVIIAVMVQFVLVPVVRNREAASLALAASEGTLVRLQRLKEAGATYRPSTSPVDFEQARTIATGWANEWGLSHQQEQLAGNQLRFTFQPAAPTVIFAWIERVETELAFSVSSAELATADTGLIKATLVVKGPAIP